MSSLPNESTSSKFPEPAGGETAAVYAGRVIDQTVVESADTGLRLVLTVMLSAALNDPEDRAAGTGPVDSPREVEVWLTLPLDNEQRLKIAVDHLNRLGFEHDDVSRLHPDHDQFVSLIGKDVHVSCRIVGDRTYWNLRWPREKLTLDRLQAGAGSLTGQIAALRRKRGKAAPAVPPEERKP